MQLSKYALPTSARAKRKRLETTTWAITPIRPFRCDHALPEDFSIVLGDPVLAEFWVMHQMFDAHGHDLPV